MWSSKIELHGHVVTKLRQQKKGGLDSTGQGPELWARGHSAKSAKRGKVHDFGMRLVPLTFSQSENTAFLALAFLCSYFR